MIERPRFELHDASLFATVALLSQSRYQRMPRLALQTVLAAMTFTPERPAVLAGKLGSSRATVQRKLDELLAAGLVAREGSRPAAAYRVLSAMETVERAREQMLAGERVRLSMTLASAHALTRVLDLNMRTGIGQLEAIGDRLRDVGPGETGFDMSCADHLALRGLLDSCKGVVLRLSAGATYGINSPKVRPDIKLLWGIQRALRHRLAWDETAASRSAGGHKGAYHTEPLLSDRLTSLWVHSEASDRSPGAGGLPQRYVLEMPRGWVAKVERAVRFSLSIYTGDLTALVSFVEQDLLVDNDGKPITAEGVRALQEFAGAGMARIHHGEVPHNLPVRGPTALLLLNLRKVLESAPVADQRLPSEDAPVVLSAVGDSPWVVDIAALPAGMLLHFAKGEYSVLAPSSHSDTFAVVARSRSVQTVAELARAVAQLQQGE